MMWLIEPQDPLLVRDGRPFGATPGARARSLPFPFPATTAGAARTRAGEENNGWFNPTYLDRVAGITVRGPLLVGIVDQSIEFFAPAPSDALLFDREDQRLDVRRLVPLTFPQTTLSDLDGELPYVVGLPRTDLRKPAKRQPPFWRWGRFSDWLLNPVNSEVAFIELGTSGPVSDRRLHVGIDPETFAGRDGALFMTGGLAFWHNANIGEPVLSNAQRLALAIDVSDMGDLAIESGFGPMGGERRLMYWRSVDNPFPRPPAGLRDQVIADRACRVVLMTPAYFESGWRPSDLLLPKGGVTPSLQAAVTGKPLTVSGWDLVTKSPRPSRRLVPAGSVYYLTLSGNPEDLGRWFDETWMRCVSDTAADNATGFGLAVVGAWSGRPEVINYEEV